ncbi:reverse transcriptase domain-containing protein [Ixodes scapularis]
MADPADAFAGGAAAKRTREDDATNPTAVMQEKPPPKGAPTWRRRAVKPNIPADDTRGAKASPRFCFCRLPFEICSALEYFRRRMSCILQGQDKVVNTIDSILVFGSTQAGHDRRLKQVLNRLEEAGVKLNKAKCAFSAVKVKFLSFLLRSSGISPDPQKIRVLAGLKEALHLTKGAAVGHVEELRNAAEIAAISDEPSPSQPYSTPSPQLDFNFKLSATERRALRDLLAEFSDCFTTTSKVRQTTVTKHHIGTNEDALPVHRPPYRVSPK